MTKPGISTNVFDPPTELKSCITQYSLLNIADNNYQKFLVKSFPFALACITLGLRGSKMKHISYPTNETYIQSSSVIGFYPIDYQTYISPAQADTRFVNINLTHIGVNQFFGIPVKELNRTNIELDCLFGREIDKLMDQLEDLERDRDIIQCLNSFFIRRLRKGLVIGDRFASKIVKITNLTHSMVSVLKLADEMNMHVRTLERTCNENIGLTPKEFLRISRFIRLKNLLSNFPQLEWSDLIVRCGFYDQAHLIHEINSVTGMPPKMFVQLARSIK